MACNPALSTLADRCATPDDQPTAPGGEAPPLKKKSTPAWHSDARRIA